MILLDAPIRAICGGFALMIFYLLNAKLVTDIQLEVIAHSMKAIYEDVHLMPPSSLMFFRCLVAVAIVKVVIQPAVKAVF